MAWYQYGMMDGWMGVGGRLIVAGWIMIFFLKIGIIQRLPALSIQFLARPWFLDPFYSERVARGGMWWCEEMPNSSCMLSGRYLQYKE